MFEKLGNIIIAIHNFNLSEYLQLTKIQEEMIYKSISFFAFLLAVGTIYFVGKKCLTEKE